MVDNSWALDLQTRIFSLIQAHTASKLRKSYPNLFYTTDEEPESVATRLPSVVVIFPTNNTFMDLKGDSINGVNFNVEIQVIVSKEQDVSSAREIYNAITNYLTGELYFRPTMPSLSYPGGNVKRLIGRFSRVIGKDDPIK